MPCEMMRYDFIQKVHFHCQGYKICCKLDFNRGYNRQKSGRKIFSESLFGQNSLLLMIIDVVIKICIQFIVNMEKIENNAHKWSKSPIFWKKNLQCCIFKKKLQTNHVLDQILILEMSHTHCQFL